MDEFNSVGYRHHGSNEYGATNMYVLRSSNHFSTPYGTHEVNKPATLPPPPPPPPPPAPAPSPAPSPILSSPWYDCRQLKRRKRIAKYKLYAFEGKVKRSWKKSFRWINRTCSKIVHGF